LASQKHIDPTVQRKYG